MRAEGPCKRALETERQLQEKEAKRLALAKAK